MYLYICMNLKILLSSETRTLFNGIATNFIKYHVSCFSAGKIPFVWEVFSSFAQLTHDVAEFSVYGNSLRKYTRENSGIRWSSTNAQPITLEYWLGWRLLLFRLLLSSSSYVSSLLSPCALPLLNVVLVYLYQFYTARARIPSCNPHLGEDTKKFLLWYIFVRYSYF